MKIKKKLIESVRIRKDRAEALKDKALDITLATKEQVGEADLVNFLIDEGLGRVKLKGDKLVLE